ncbi:probable G-protein coupled receptor 82 [Rhinichthys klamathensis goyatoka]|uniref:probable G-protein coupled receptor 82 n=1 Tax=Rhinichthys klamathensis goyatoka TaxID=3034132 RepID=UPI0024B4F378|nr:probable G-protein coupled receptor 82 [Rhinichthys klamathensis goyatoka]
MSVQGGIAIYPSGVNDSDNNQSTCRIHPEESNETILPWLYLFLAVLGLPTNGIVLVDLWRSERTPTVIFTLNIIVSDLLICCSFFFRIAYYKENINWLSGSPACNAVELINFSCFYINLYCNMSFLLWTSINRYATVVKPGYAFFRIFKRTLSSWILCFSTWSVITTVVSTSMGLKLSLQINGTCFDQVVNSYILYRGQFKTIHCVGVSAFFFILCLMLVSYSLLVFHLQKVRGARFGPGGTLKVRRKILASVIMFVLCFLPYHVQRIILLLTSDNENCQAKYRIKTSTIFIAALSCCLHPILQLVFRLRCCRANRNTRVKPKPEASKSLDTPQIHTIHVTENIEEPQKNGTELSHEPKKNETE